ncbi:restriction endonuclease subunit S [Erysipelothrix sp. HDW6A]|uniref:restriction endonuclease subunit S n=1 Tax=Erysipelothrix sp. HDW6A TaxID=2714928 RepID=UPI0021045870|nr:restriction endonuclease subunit S [Erysipelothrix sp. HDW6A]
MTPCLENGKTAQVTILDDDEVAFGSTEYIVLRHKIGITDNNYIFYLALSQYVRDTAIKSMTGTSGRQRAQTDVIENTKIMLPPLDEQKAIAHILSTLDDKIEVNNQINKTLENMAQAIFKQWFVDFEFPNEDGEPYKSSGGEMIESELGLIPKGWEVGCIGDYVKVKSGFAFKSAWWTEKGVPVVKIKSLQNGTINFSDVGYVDKDKVDKAREFIVNGGDLLIAMTGATIGKIGLVPKYPHKILVNQRVGKFFLGNLPIKKISFLFCLISQKTIYDEIVSRGDGSAQPNISPSQIESIKIVLPPKEMINKMNNKTQQNFEKMIQNLRENMTLSQLRDTLLPKLISGEIRVPLESESDAS